MPIIKTWCLPPNQTEEQLNMLHNAIVAAVVSVPELGLKDENDITNLFPPDQMQYGLGTTIVIEVCGLLEKPERTHDVRDCLAEAIVKAVQTLYPDTKKIECFVYSFNPAISGSWVSENI